ncbi:probable polygalacturonase At3g15720 [Neltuma alba]|uniref:probable polygalacturonase At3g15720 n=1 Tax=Neltuma alba TaxID=207710 RepID=UPI0010A3948A|nr:probable polygalacturonase At3g15720 [Prosopis alba]
MEGLIAIIFLCFVASPFFPETITAQPGPIFNVLDFGAAGDGKTDDSQAFLKAWTNVCNSTQGKPSTLLIPEGKTFMLQPVLFQGPCKPSSIYFWINGTIIAPASVNAWKWPDDDMDAWIRFLEVYRLHVRGNGTFDGQGAPWWDCFAKNQCQRPQALSFHKCASLELVGFRVVNSPGGHISVDDCQGSNISNVRLDAPQDSPNTDGIDIANSSNVVVAHSSMQLGDDCIAIDGGSSFINITGIFCGPGHGISIGSLGKDGSYAQVEEIHVRNCTFTRTSNGARIKTWKGGSGFARKITFEDMILVEAQHPVIIDQNYRAYSPKDDDNKAVKVSDVTFRNFQGTAASENAIQLLCDRVIGCTNIVLDQIHITSSVPGKTADASCLNAHGKSSPSNVPQAQCLLT